MSLFQIAFLGALVGVPLGYAMQRTNLCFNSAYREVLLRRNTVLLRGILLAILIQMLGLTILIQLNVSDLQMNVVPFYWLAAIVGGFVFGIAMVYAEGCSSTVRNRNQLVPHQTVPIHHTYPWLGQVLDKHKYTNEDDRL
jgi:hypothetical protein